MERLHDEGAQQTCTLQTKESSPSSAHHVTAVSSSLISGNAASSASQSSFSSTNPSQSIAVVSKIDTHTHARRAFLVDSGATHHCVRLRSLFSSFRPGKSMVQVANGKTISAIGRGEVHLPVITAGGTLRTIILSDVLYTPQISNNIFSTSAFLANNSAHAVSLKSGSASLILDSQGETLIPLLHSSSLFWLIPDGSTTPSSLNHALAGVSQTQQRLSLNLFHQRLGHASEDVCRTLAKDLGIILQGKSLACAVCARAKMKKKAITSLAASPAVPTAPGQCIYLDIKGPLEHVAYTGDKYAFVYVDEATRITIVKTATTKDKIVAMTASALDGFSTFPLTSIPVGQGTTLHSDSEAVIQSNAMKEMLARRKISFRTSPPKTQEINGIVERSIQTLLNSARCLLTEANMPNQYWTLALQHACYLKNYLPTASLGNKSPIQVLTGMDKRIDHLRIFGSAAYVKIDEQIREALGPKARKRLICRPQ